VRDPQRETPCLAEKKKRKEEKGKDPLSLCPSSRKKKGPASQRLEEKKTGYRREPSILIIEENCTSREKVCASREIEKGTEAALNFALKGGKEKKVEKVDSRTRIYKRRGEGVPHQPLDKKGYSFGERKARTR